MNDSRSIVTIGALPTYPDTKFTEITSLVCQLLHVTCIYVKHYPSFSAIIRDVQASKIDMSISDATFTAERMKTLDFSPPLFVSSDSYVIDVEKPKFCVEPLNAFDLSVYVVAGVAALLLCLILPEGTEWIFGNSAKIVRWKRNTYRSIIILIFCIDFGEFMLDVFYEAQMTDTLTVVCKHERYTTDRLIELLRLEEVREVYSELNASGLQIGLGFQNREYPAAIAARSAFRLGKETKLSDIFSCENVLDRRKNGEKPLVYVENTVKIVERLRERIQRCCVQMSRIDDLAVEYIGIAISKKAGITKGVSRAVRQLHEGGFVARVEARNDNFEPPNCEKAEYTEFVKEGLSVVELKSAFYLFLLGCAAGSTWLLLEWTFYALWRRATFVYDVREFDEIEVEGRWTRRHDA